MKASHPSGPSLSMRLSLSLVSIVFVVVTTILAIGFSVYSRNLKSDLIRQSEEYGSRLADILALPLWNYDETQIRRIGSVFSQNQMIHGLLVRDEQGRALFEARKAEDHAPRIYRSDEIRIEGRSIGTVSIEITQAMQLLHLRLLLLGTLFTLLAALVVMVLGVNHLLRRFLRSPLEALEEAMDRVASGDFSHALDDSHRELRGIARRYTEMVERVHSREEELQRTNLELLGDITERKQAHEALKRANLVLENSPVMLFQWRAAPGWPVELVSENIRQLGYEPGQLLSGELPFADMIHPEDLERVAGEVRDFTERGLPRYQQMYRVVTRDGRVRWVDDRTFVERDGEGRVTHYQGMVMDITERREAEEALRESEARFRALFENMPSGMALHEVISEDGGKVVDYRILDVNPAHERHTGLSAEQVRGALGSEAYGTGSAPFLEGLGDVAGSGRPLVLETYFEPLQRHFQIAAFSPQPGLFATILEDITARRRNEEELRQKTEEMERFVYTISHDLKSPLVTIQAFLKYLEQDLQSGDRDRARRDMDYIRNAAARMNRLLDELLELSRIGRKVNPPENVVLQDVVRDAFGLVAGRIVEGGIQVEVTPEPVLLHGDRARLVEVFQNLIDNAAKFMGDQASPIIWIGAEEGEGGLVIHVRDNGVGVEPRYHEKVFGLFEKLDAGSEGTGVGLALVKRIIEVHSGRIWMESEGLGRGTVFRFTLPGARKITAR